jgi:rhodanese-related sulfurtransferase
MPNNVSPSDIPRITVEEAKRLYDGGDTIFLDVRKPEHYRKLRVNGAISIPLKGPASRYWELPREKDIVIY